MMNKRQHLYAVIDTNYLLLALFPERKRAKNYAKEIGGKVIFTSTGFLNFIPQKVRTATWPYTQGLEHEEQV